MRPWGARRICIKTCSRTGLCLVERVTTQVLDASVLFSPCGYKHRIWNEASQATIKRKRHRHSPAPLAWSKLKLLSVRRFLRSAPFFLPQRITALPIWGLPRGRAAASSAAGHRRPRLPNCCWTQPGRAVSGHDCSSLRALFPVCPLAVAGSARAPRSSGSDPLRCESKGRARHRRITARDRRLWDEHSQPFWCRLTGSVVNVVRFGKGSCS